MKVADTDAAAFKITVQVRLEPEQPAPFQPTNEEPTPGVAVSTIVVPLA